KQPGQTIVSSSEISADRPKLITLDWVHSRVRAFEPTNPYRSSIKAHILNTKIDSFTAPEAMPTHHQEQQMISGPLPASLSCLQECLDLCGIEKILWSMGIGRTLNIIRVGNIEHSCDFSRL